MNDKKNGCEKGWAVITGADGGMGREITRAVALAGYRIIMACYRLEKAEKVRQQLAEETGNRHLELLALDLSSMDSVVAFTQEIARRNLPIALLMNNAGTMETGLHITSDGFERTVSVNYLGPYLLTRRLLPLLVEGARVVNMVSCTYAIGKIDFSCFFQKGKRGSFWRIPIYSNTKLALTLFTFELSERLNTQGVVVNAADPGVVSTDIITMHQWFDPLTDLFFRPFIRTPRQGAASAIKLLLGEAEAAVTGQMYASEKARKISPKYRAHVQKKQLWDETEKVLQSWLD